MSAVRRKNTWAPAMLWVPVAALAVFLILVGLSARSLSNKPAFAGSIVLSDVSLHVNELGHWLDARADINLPDSIRAGLDSGVSLDFILDLHFKQARPFWFDKTLAHHQQRFTLTYYELTRHYRVYDHTFERSRNYRSLSSALTGLGEFERLPVSVPEGVDVQAALGLKLDTQSLPLPLQPLVTSNWRLTSEEYLWPVN